MPPARDYKRVGDGDTGPNTGGMGGYTWPSYATPDLLTQVEHTILRPTVAGMAAEGQPYRGLLYCGLMLTAEGPRVLEFNCRFGDPEAQLILPLLESSLLEVCQSACEGRLVQPRWSSGATCGVVLAAPGYPERPQLGAPIAGLDRLPPGVLAFHAGTAACVPEKSRAAIERPLERLQPDPSQPALGDQGAFAGDPGTLVTSGGRVLTLVAVGESLGQARQRVYAAAPLVTFNGVHYRSDIGREAAVAV
jgi:phosphoribosylamine--glycine ligase